MKTWLVLTLAAAIVSSAEAFGAAASRTLFVDASGVLRWRDNGEEAVLFGVNYYPPFSGDYATIKELGLDAHEVIRQDVCHFRRLGFNCLRLHAFDQSISTPDGGLVDNEHLELLDYLIAETSKAGIYTILTPIAWWGPHKVTRPKSFSARFLMPEMTSDPEARRCQIRFLREFACHVNRYTGKSYGDDPAVAAFECINEPMYRPDADNDSVIGYINALVDSLKAVSPKPIFYCGWNGWAEAVGRSNADGLSGSYYPAGCRSYRAHRDLQLGKIVASTLYRTREDVRARRQTFRRPPDSVACKARMIYEFDASDTPGAYMFPAMVKLFRAEEVQIAAQFAYDCMALADRNRSWQTHYLNLVYTPEIAISMAIAAEAMKRVPRGGVYVPNGYEIDFPPFYVNAIRNLSQMVTDTKYLYTATPTLPPPNPDRLGRIYGCGASTVAASSGSGAYFLDKVRKGVWRLQLYPSILEIADPYRSGCHVKRVVVESRPSLFLNLPDLGANYCVRNMSGEFVCKAEKGCVTISPGDFIVAASEKILSADFADAVAMDIPPYVAPAPVSMRMIETLRRENAIMIGAPVRDRHDPGKWNFCEWIDMENATPRGKDGVITRKLEGGRRFLRVEHGGFHDERVFGARIATSGADYRAAFPKIGSGRTLFVHARATTVGTKNIQIVMIDDANRPWGTIVPLTMEWRTIRIDIPERMKYLTNWRPAETPPINERADVRRAVAFDFLMGRWLFKGGDGSERYGFDVESVTVED